MGRKREPHQSYYCGAGIDKIFYAYKKWSSCSHTKSFRNAARDATYARITTEGGGKNRRTDGRAL